MKVLYYSNFCDEKIKEKFDSGSSIRLSPAAYNFNKKIVDGLLLNDVAVKCYSNISSSIMTSSQHDYDFYQVKKSRYMPQALKLFTNTFRSTFKELKQDKNTIVLCDAMSLNISLASVLACKLLRRERYAIVTDFYEYIGNYKDEERTLINKLFVSIGNKLIKSFNGYVVLSEDMMNKLPNKPHVLIEGLVEHSVKPMRKKKHICLYSGSIQKAYGIINLMQAFNEIETDDYELHIYGVDATYESFNAELNDKVIYKGFLPVNELVIKQQEASILVNPRPIGDEYTKYSFPSKLLEYLNANTATITTKLSGIPREYDELFYYFDNDSVEGIKKGLVTLLSKSDKEMEEHANVAFEYIQKHKNNTIQCKKIIELIQKKGD